MHENQVKGSDFKQVILQNLDIELHWVLILLSQWISFHFVQFWPFSASESLSHHHRHVLALKNSLNILSLSLICWSLKHPLSTLACALLHWTLVCSNHFYSVVIDSILLFLHSDKPLDCILLLQKWMLLCKSIGEFILLEYSIYCQLWAIDPCQLNELSIDDLELDLSCVYNMSLFTKRTTLWTATSGLADTVVE